MPSQLCLQGCGAERCSSRNPEINFLINKSRLAGHLSDFKNTHTLKFGLGFFFLECVFVVWFGIFLLGLFYKNIFKTSRLVEYELLLY